MDSLWAGLSEDGPWPPEVSEESSTGGDSGDLRPAQCSALVSCVRLRMALLEGGKPSRRTLKSPAGYLATGKAHKAISVSGEAA